MFSCNLTLSVYSGRKLLTDSFLIDHLLFNLLQQFQDVQSQVGYHKEVHGDISIKRLPPGIGKKERDCFVFFCFVLIMRTVEYDLKKGNVFNNALPSSSNNFSKECCRQPYSFCTFSYQIFPFYWNALIQHSANSQPFYQWPCVGYRPCGGWWSRSSPE